MIYRVRVTNRLDRGFEHVYELPGAASFEVLCGLLQQGLGLGRDELVSFHVKGPGGEHGLELTMLSAESVMSGYPVVSMGEVRVQDLLREAGDEVFFTYDMLANSALDVRLEEVIPEEGVGCYGRCVSRRGELSRRSVRELQEASQADIASLLSGNSGDRDC